MKALSRIVALLVLGYLFGFGWFVAAMPHPAGNETSDAIVVLTGAEGRIDRAVDLLRRKRAPRLFVAGVDPKVRTHEFAAEYRVPASLMACCVTLDFRSTNTLSNAAEVGDWLAKRKVRSIRLVTSDWHMRRSVLELRRVLPEGTLIIADAVKSRPSFQILVLEYNKLLAREAGLGGQ